jgi:hypothetical protein
MWPKICTPVPELLCVCVCVSPDLLLDSQEVLLVASEVEKSKEPSLWLGVRSPCGYVVWRMDGGHGLLSYLSRAGLWKPDGTTLPSLAP